MKFTKFPYEKLNARQKESHNYQKLSAILALYGFSTIRITDDWYGADFLATHASGGTVLKVQLKPRLYFSKAYKGKKLWLCFPVPNGAYLIPHDKALRIVLRERRCLSSSKSWKERNAYSMNSVPKWLKPKMKRYFMSAEGIFRL